MTCTDVDERDIAESYLLGRLNEDDRTAFEQHYFECARCYSQLEAIGAVREALARQPRRSTLSSRWPWLAAAAALLLAISSALVWQSLRSGDRAQPAGNVVSAPAERPPSPNPEELARLAVFAPPPYSPTRFRNSADRAAFTLGMREYVAQEFQRAIPALERALRESPSAEDARFYLGASYLLAGRSPDAISALDPLASSTRSPYAEEAQFLIAKAHLKAGDLPAALVALDKTTAMRGDREQEARALRTRVAALAPSR